MGLILARCCSSLMEKKGLIICINTPMDGKNNNICQTCAVFTILATPSRSRRSLGIWKFKNYSGQCPVILESFSVAFKARSSKWCKILTFIQLYLFLLALLMTLVCFQGHSSLMLAIVLTKFRAIFICKFLSIFVKLGSLFTHVTVSMRVISDVCRLFHL